MIFTTTMSCCSTFSVLVGTTFAIVKVAVNIFPTNSVTFGNQATLKCQYTDITEPSALVVRWEHKTFDQTAGSRIWLYDGRINLDTGDGDYGKFEKIQTDIMKEHAIMLKHAQLADEGLYFCHVEYYPNYKEERANRSLTVIGMNYYSY